MADPADDASADDEESAAAPSDADAPSDPDEEGTEQGSPGERVDEGDHPADEPDEDLDGGDEHAGDGADDGPDEEADTEAADESGTEEVVDGTADGETDDGTADSEDGDADDAGGPPTFDPNDIGPGTVDDGEDGEEGPYKPFSPDVELEDPEEVAKRQEAEADEGATDEVDAAVEAEPAGATGSSSPGLIDAEVGHAPDDQEQPLEEHIQEMVYRFLAVAVAMAGVAAVALLWSDDLINFLWYSFLGPGAPLCPGGECPQSFRPHLYHPLSLVLARLKIAVLVGFVVGLPVAVYQTYLFMRPGLYPRERRYYLAAVPTSLVLAAVGVLFAYALVLPALFSYFMGYSTRAAEAALGLAETFNIIVIMLGFFALVFQIPLLVMLAIMMGVTTRRWLESRRLYFWMGFGGVAFIFSPDPTGMAPLLVALTMIALFEGTLTLLRWTGRDSPVFAPEPMRAHRPHAIAFAALVGYAVSDLPLPTGYYDALPPVVLDALADLGLTAWTPLLVGVGIVAVFEIGFSLLRRFGGGLLRLQLALYRVRRAVWVGAAVVGYLASPDPVILDTLRATALEPVEVGAVVLGIVVLYELLVQLIVWRRG